MVEFSQNKMPHVPASSVLRNVLPFLTILVRILLIPPPAYASIEIAQYPGDLQPFYDDNEGSNETLVLRKGYNALEQAVLFNFYKNGRLTYVANGANVERLDTTGCAANDHFAFLLHGWRETCEVEWMGLLIAKLTKHRRGCIICVDYRAVSLETYVRLLRKFEPLTSIITKKLKYLQVQGVNPNKVYMFGFSFGGQLAVAVGKNIGPKQIKEIDTCDMAGPGFDLKPSSFDHRSAAQNVQCIHTSRDKGTKNYECHQDWRMGNCGISQDAADRPPKGSHGLCPYFYISAFDNPFYAVQPSMLCASRKPAQSWPDNFKMGYMETRKSLVYGELFAITSNSFPYNVLDKRLSLDDILLSQLTSQREAKYRQVRIANVIKKARRLFHRRSLHSTSARSQIH